jgi:hypothetical protein
MQLLCGSGGRCSLPRQQLLQRLPMLPGTSVQGQRSRKQQLQLGAKVMQQRSAGGVVHSSALTCDTCRRPVDLPIMTVIEELICAVLRVNRYTTTVPPRWCAMQWVC